MTITVTEMQEKLYDVETLYENLAATEHLETLDVSMDGTKGITTFVLPPGWNIGLKEKDGQDLTDAKIGIGSKEYSLTKDAILSMTSSVGIQQTYVLKTPGPMIQSHLNYWATHSVDKDLKVLVKDDTVLSVTKAGIKPFSNHQLLSQTVDRICDKYDCDPGELWVDYKSSHDLAVTNIRLIIPPAQRTLVTHRSEEDVWYGGIALRNSLTGQTPLSVEGYVFAWECTNGALTQHNAAKYNRKIQGQDEAEVYQWAADSVDAVLGGLEHEFDTVEALVSENLESGVNQVLADIFKTYKVPLKLRQPIIEALVDSGDMSYYGVMQAITQVANRPGLPEHFVTAIMRIGGDLAHNASERCVACKRTLS